MNLKNVRLSYPQLFEPKAIKNGKPAYSASFLLHKTDNADQIEKMRAEILKTAEAQWGAGNVKWNAGKLFIKKPDGKAAAVEICLRDGIEKAETDGYGERILFFSARNESAPAVVDRNPANRLSKEIGRPYAGCYVNAEIRLWGQDNDYGRRVNAQLQAIQFYRDGDAFGDAPVEPTSVFANVESESSPASDQDWPTDDGETPPAKNDTASDDITF